MLNQMTVCRAIVFIGGILLTVTTAVAADVVVNSDPFSDKGTVVAKTTVKDIEMQVIFDRHYSAGHAMECVLLVTNRNQKAIEYWESGLLQGFIFSVGDADGKPVPLTAFGTKRIRKSDRMAFKNIIRKLPPGESILMKVNIANYYDMTMTGKYKLSVEWSSDPGGDPDVKIAGLEFEVREP